MSLLDKLKTLTSVTHRNRSEKLSFWKNEVRSGYSNGKWSINPAVVDQKELLSTGGSNKVGLRYYNDGTSTTSTVYTRIYYYIPATRHANQKATVYFENGSYTRTQTISLPTSAYTDAYTTTYQYLSRAKAGTITVTIPEYYDIVNDTYYTGVRYHVTFTDLTSSIEYYEVVYE